MPSRHIRTIHCPALPAMLLWLEGYKYTIKYDDGDAEEFSEKGGGKYIKTIQQFKNAIIVAYVFE